MPLDQPGRHAVLITRPEGPAAEGTADRVRALGWEPVGAPLLRVRPRPVRWPAGAACVLVTSGQAVPALDGWRGGAVLAVGDATAARARALGLAEVESAGGTAEDLLGLALRRLAPGDRAVLLSGAGQGGALAAGLRAAGIRVHRRVAYAVRPVGRLPAAAVAALRGGRVRAALFLSADTARAFARLLPDGLAPVLAEVDALAIAPGVAEALAPLPWRRVRVSVGPTLDQVLALL